MIKIERLYKSFGNQPVLRGVDLNIPQGKTTVVIGKSGSGKSVLIKHILALLRPDSGRVLVDGREISSATGRELGRLRTNFGLCFQNAALFDSMNVFDNVAFPLVEHSGFSRAQIKQRVEETLTAVGMEGTEDKFPSELSGGMRKRVGVARAIVHRPQIILYDEPTTGLDPITASTINDLVIDVQKRLGLTCVVITHDVAATFRVGHYIAFLHEGVINAYGTPDEIENDPSPKLREFIRRGRAG
ncbi:MAG: ABC transporter ATP-binding protein [Deltaproteobacteria bacterium]|nr:ABC transporter ATP-binding protein [Deltaproteobacteria bacterium]